MEVDAIEFKTFETIEVIEMSVAVAAKTV